MNYLAHVYLSGESNKKKIGNLLGDFVKKIEDYNFEKEIVQGIYLHRKIDSFTDSHEIFLESKRRLSSEYKHFKAVIIDIFYDHFLAKNWSQFSKISLEEYSNDFYKALNNYSYCLPDKLLNIMPIMIEENWLLSYRKVEGIEKSLYRISKKMNRLNISLEKSIQDLLENYDKLESDFKSFFPQVSEYVNNQKIEL